MVIFSGVITNRIWDVDIEHGNPVYGILVCMEGSPFERLNPKVACDAKQSLNKSNKR